VPIFYILIFDETFKKHSFLLGFLLFLSLGFAVLQDVEKHEKLFPLEEESYTTKWNFRERMF
jgi:hypothetical protein